jgi:hypothetical protein
MHWRDVELLICTSRVQIRLAMHGRRLPLGDEMLLKKPTEVLKHGVGTWRCWRARDDSNVRPLPSEGSTLSS